jgi:hypothetical protein
MIRLALQLTLHSGREASVRLAVTAVSVAVGVALLLGVLAEFHAFQANANRACWECTTGAAVPATLPHQGELWNNSVDFYQGQTIERLDVAALGPGAPVPPGVSRLPGPGQYYASPALAALLRTVPADQLGDRFPGTMSGTIGNAALNGPGELAIYIGYAPSALKSIDGTQLVTTLSTAPSPPVFTSFFRGAFVVGALAVLFPILILISTATRLAAARREERLAALRLIGATPRDIRIIAATEATVTALCGTVLGTIVFLLVQPALANAAPIGTRYFAGTVTPTIGGYVVLGVAVPAASAVAALMSLRRVQISPLGVARHVSPPPPTPWRLATLAVGVISYMGGLLLTSRQSIGASAYPGLILIMIGLVVAGPWLTVATAQLVTHITSGAASLLATRRLADNPKAAFRSMTGLVLAVFLGTIVGVLVPVIDAAEGSPNASALSNVLLDNFTSSAAPPTTGPGDGRCRNPVKTSTGLLCGPPSGYLGLSPRAGATLLRELKGIKGAAVYPIYSLPQSTNAVISCSALRELAVLGQCAPGIKAVEADDTSLISSDNPQDSTKAFVTTHDPAYTGSLSVLALQAVLVRVNSPATLELVRTFLATHTPPPSGGEGAAATPPRTFAEAVAIRTSRATTLEKIAYAAAALTLIVAGCSLAVAVGSGLVERKRPFTLLRVSGTPVSTLSEVVLMEAALPMAAVAVIAAGIAYGTSILAVARLAPAGTAIPHPGQVYYVTMGSGLAIALVIILLTLPMLHRITSPDNIRFE